jgi:HPr kinase/phosphorylase
MSLHATTVSVDGLALLIAGPSGSGKSGLAAGMIAFGATLVSDDLTCLSVKGGRLMADAPASGAGLIELRGIGPCRVPCRGLTPVGAILRMMPSTARLPEPASETFLGQAVRTLTHPSHPDLAAKMMLWMRAAAMQARPAS